jgi:hypothetical protein
VNKHTLKITQGLWDLILELQGLEIRPVTIFMVMLMRLINKVKVTVMLLVVMVMMLMEDVASNDWMSEIGVVAVHYTSVQLFVVIFQF